MLALPAMEKMINSVTDCIQKIQTELTKVGERQNTLVRDLEHMVEDIKALKESVDKLDKKWIVEESKNLVTGKFKNFFTGPFVTMLPWIIALFGLLGFGGEQLYKMPSPEQQAQIEQLKHK